MDQDKALFSRRYWEDAFFDDAYFEPSFDGSNVMQLFGAGGAWGAAALSDEFPEEALRILGSGCIPADKELVVGSKRFIAAAKAFSEEHEVSADIIREKCCIDAWLYFSAELITDERKADLTKLIGQCHELMIIPHPNGMPKWCEYAVVLTYVTNRTLFETNKKTAEPKKGGTTYEKHYKKRDRICAGAAHSYYERIRSDEEGRGGNDV
ncbi:MAG: hypothetical protein J5586_07640 [Clostridia bacterium]|nr:hypothetical protein [Clostridia bacterium]